MILHIPHASQVIPGDERNSFVCDDAALERELLRSTDAYTDELFDATNATRIVFPVSRLVVDPERFLDDAQEPMAVRGRGVVYTRTVDGQPLAKLRDEGVASSWGLIRNQRITRYYTPHHQRLERAVADALVSRGFALIIDCHSFPSAPWLVERNPEALRPEFCIGTDPFHTPPDLTNLTTSFFRDYGHTVEVNRPYAGSIVPMAHFQNNPCVVSIMIEVRRDLYMDESTGAKNTFFSACHDVLRGLLKELGDWEKRRGVGV